MRQPRIEEQVVLLAYGELDAGEAEVLSRRIEADPALRALYDKHLRVREATRAVPPPPAPSLSTEQLRERILSGSVRKRGAGWGWAFAGAGVSLAGVLAFLTASLSPDLQVGGISTRKPTLTVALNDLPAPHEWVPSLINDISSGRVKPVVVDRPHAATAYGAGTGVSSKRAVDQQRKGSPAVEPSPLTPTLSHRGRVGVRAVSDEDATELTVVVVSQNGRAMELEGTDGVAFGG